MKDLGKTKAEDAEAWKVLIEGLSDEFFEKLALNRLFERGYLEDFLERFLAKIEVLKGVVPRKWESPKGEIIKMSRDDTHAFTKIALNLVKELENSNNLDLSSLELLIKSSLDETKIAMRNLPQ